MQCVLNKRNIYHIAWIPKKYAKIGKEVKLRIDNMQTTNWIITEIYEDEITGI